MKEKKLKVVGFLKMEKRVGICERCGKEREYEIREGDEVYCEHCYVGAFSDLIDVLGDIDETG